MNAMEGIVMFAQESRFQLLDGGGVAHHFILGHSALAEPQQLPALQRRQARVRVLYKPAENMLAHVATSIYLLPA